MRKSSNVFLVGPMGVGKTTIGRLLADILKKKFIDLDEEIERRCGANIPWIFDVEGEAGFRKRESDLLQSLAPEPNMVLATGGGVVLSEANRNMLKQNGFVIYLTASVEKLYERTLKDKRRPLLQVQDRKSVIKNLLAQRDALYRQTADLVYEVGGNSSNVSARRIAEKVQSCVAMI